jgi:hypothetical protein
MTFQLEFHARPILAEGDGVGPGYLFDHDPRASAFRAYKRLLRNIDAYSTDKQAVGWKIAAKKLRPVLQRVARNYWRDFDRDDRKRSAEIKAEVRKLVKPLAKAIKVLEDQSFYVHQSLNAQASSAIYASGCEATDVFMSTVAANKNLLDACQALVRQKHRKVGGAMRFQNAARELCAVWEDIFNQSFPKNIKNSAASDRQIAVGVRRIFDNSAAEFVFVALYEIGNPLKGGRSWVKASQVEDALAVVLFTGGK